MYWVFKFSQIHNSVCFESRLFWIVTCIVVLENLWSPDQDLNLGPLAYSASAQCSTSWATRPPNIRTATFLPSFCETLPTVICYRLPKFVWTPCQCFSKMATKGEPHKCSSLGGKKNMQPRIEPQTTYLPYQHYQLSHQGCLLQEPLHLVGKIFQLLQPGVPRKTSSGN